MRGLFRPAREASSASSLGQRLHEVGKKSALSLRQRFEIKKCCRSLPLVIENAGLVVPACVVDDVVNTADTMPDEDFNNRPDDLARTQPHLCAFITPLSNVCQRKPQFRLRLRLLPSFGCWSSTTSAVCLKLPPPKSNVVSITTGAPSVTMMTSATDSVVRLKAPMQSYMTSVVTTIHENGLVYCTVAPETRSPIPWCG
jgi:hypothetical protein